MVQLSDQTLSGSESRAKIKLREVLAEWAKLSEDRLALLDEILPVLATTVTWRCWRASATTSGSSRQRCWRRCGSRAAPRRSR
ncbi:hypothetical protein ACF090_34535 [Streptomyces sp. NPDC014892]|uniref:hypothetical protein n=1 Tax=Streptomyces sp. NPDC014892 TaxID=3364930 RepID=UPI0036F84FA6